MLWLMVLRRSAIYFLLYWRRWAAAGERPAALLIFESNWSDADFI